MEIRFCENKIMPKYPSFSTRKISSHDNIVMLQILILLSFTMNYIFTFIVPLKLIEW